MFTAFLIKYAEIGVKGKNRYIFEEALVKQIEFALSKIEGQFKTRRTQGMKALKSWGRMSSILLKMCIRIKIRPLRYVPEGPEKIIQRAPWRSTPTWAVLF